MNRKVILKRWSVRLLVIAAVLGMLTLLGFAKGSKEAPSDSTRKDTTITDAVISVDSSESASQDTLFNENNLPPRDPQPYVGMMGEPEVRYVRDGVEYTDGSVYVRSATDSIVLVENGVFIFHRSGIDLPPKEWPGCVVYYAEWPIDFDFNRILNHVILVKYSKKLEYRLNVSADSMDADTAKAVDSSEGAAEMGK